VLIDVSQRCISRARCPTPYSAARVQREAASVTSLFIVVNRGGERQEEAAPESQVERFFGEVKDLLLSADELLGKWGRGRVGSLRDPDFCAH
jgi:hypothetical protein